MSSIMNPFPGIFVMAPKAYNWQKKEWKAGVSVAGLIFPNFKKIIFINRLHYCPEFIEGSSSVATFGLSFSNSFEQFLMNRTHRDIGCHMGCVFSIVSYVHLCGSKNLSK